MDNLEALKKIRDQLNKFIDEIEFRKEIDSTPINEELEEPKKSWSCRDCGNTTYWVNEVKKDGPNKGKHFISCRKCKMFGGFTSEPLSK